LGVPKIICFYFPQFHAIPENDKWWYKGFTDWDLVKKAKPLYINHRQPRVPQNENYYDPTKKEVLADQIEIAKDHGIGGFMFYHYWFDGKKLLEKPMEILLNNKDLDFPYCICWANEQWTRTWQGKDHIVLQAQTHKADKEMWTSHFNYLLPYFKDNRYLKIDNRPVFLIYQPNIIKEFGDMANVWNGLATKNNLSRMFFIFIKGYSLPDRSELQYFDGYLKYQPREASSNSNNPYSIKKSTIEIIRYLPIGIQNILKSVYRKYSSWTIVDSEKTWEFILKNVYKNEYSKYKNLSVFESAFWGWDNTARYKNTATIYTDMDPEKKEKYLTELLLKARDNNSPFVFFNAWNEWSEGSYLEPDMDLGFMNLEIIKKVVTNINCPS
jgi:lipopolysaccharide biosynthesis protein